MVSIFIRALPDLQQTHPFPFLSPPQGENEEPSSLTATSPISGEAAS